MLDQTETTVEVSLSMLHYLAQAADAVLAFLPGGGVWAGDESELNHLAEIIEMRWERMNEELVAKLKSSGKAANA